MRSLSLKVSENLDRGIADLAARRGISKSALIREAVSDLIARERAPEPNGGKSFLALAEDLAGTLDGPEDLSTNPDYLNGYGQ